MSLRIRAPLPAGDVRRGRGQVSEDPYMSRMVKLVPAEAIGIYPIMMQQAEVLTPHGSGPRFAVYFAAWMLLLIVIVLRWRATAEPGRGAQWGAVLIAAVAFFIWVHVMGGDFGFEMLADQVFKSPQSIAGDPTRSAPVAPGMDPDQLRKFVSNTALVTWTILAPVVYRGEEQG